MSIAVKVRKAKVLVLPIVAKLTRWYPQLVPIFTLEIFGNYLAFISLVVDYKNHHRNVDGIYIVI